MRGSSSISASNSGAHGTTTAAATALGSNRSIPASALCPTGDLLSELMSEPEPAVAAAAAAVAGSSSAGGGADADDAVFATPLASRPSAGPRTPGAGAAVDHDTGPGAPSTTQESLAGDSALAPVAAPAPAVVEAGGGSAGSIPGNMARPADAVAGSAGGTKGDAMAAK
eukprot:SAG22_NODE_5471_length_1008_cov_0.778878_1_plen_168_part_10